MLAGADDKLWPACDFTARAMKVLETSGHAAMRSLSPEDPWAWCYVHKVYGTMKTETPAAGART